MHYILFAVGAEPQRGRRIRWSCSSANMQLISVEAVLILVLLQISSLRISASDCLAVMETCMSDLCRHQRAFCEDEACHIKGFEVCNSTIQTAMDRFPSLRGCVCAWEDELCDSIQALAKQCSRKPAVIQQKKSTVMDWKSSSLIDSDVSGSCVDRVSVCVSDPVCNRHLASVLQACMTEQCDNNACQREIQQFYGNMPQKTAEMLVMCECEDSDQSCLLMQTGLQSGACGAETWICQERLEHCVQERVCRKLLKTFLNKCWYPEETECSEADLHMDECFSLMDPAHIRGADSECRKSFLATLGTVLHQPCTCKGVHSDHLQTCSRFRDVFHDRRHFIKLSEKGIGPSKPPESNRSIHDPSWSHAFLLAAAILTLLVVAATIWLRRRGKIKRDQSKKRNLANL